MESGTVRRNGTHRDSQCQRREEDRGRASAEDILSGATGA
jgi:hypothetical protein